MKIYFGLFLSQDKCKIYDINEITYIIYQLRSRLNARVRTYCMVLCGEEAWNTTR